MIFKSDTHSMTPQDRAVYGFARCRDVAFDAVRELWRRRSAEGVTQKQIAEAIGKDTAWVSRNLSGPGNWTLRTIGGFVEALNGEIEITIRAIEDHPIVRRNYDAYADYKLHGFPTLPAAPSALTSSQTVPAGPMNTLTFDPIGDAIEKSWRGNSAAPVPVLDHA